MAIQLQREHGSIGTAVPDREADAQEAQLRRAARQHARCWRGGRAGRRAGKRCTVVRKALCKLIGGCESTLPVRLHLARGVLVAGVLRADLAGAVGVHGCAQLRRAARHPACLLKPLKPDSCMHVCHCSHRIHCFTKRSGASTKIGSCCFPSGLLTCAGTVVLHVDENRLSPSSRHIRGMRMDASGCSTPRSMSGSKRVRSSGSTHPDVTTDRSQT